MEYEYSAGTVEAKEDPMMLNGCDEDNDEQRFIARGDKTIRLAEDEDLCITYVGNRGLGVFECTDSIFQQWDRVQKKGHFKISPAVDHNRCVTNHHHPREKERVSISSEMVVLVVVLCNIYICSLIQLFVFSLLYTRRCIWIGAISQRMETLHTGPCVGMKVIRIGV